MSQSRQMKERFEMLNYLLMPAKAVFIVQCVDGLNYGEVMTIDSTWNIHKKLGIVNGL